MKRASLIKGILPSLLIALLFTVMPGNVSLAADAGTIMYVNNPAPEDRLNLRAKASSSADTRGRYFNGTSVNVLSWSGEYAKVSICETTGFMDGKFLSQTPVSTPALQFAAVNVPGSGKTQNLLNAAKKGAQAIDRLSNGDVVYIIGEEGAYYHVRTVDMAGYIDKAALAVEGASGKMEITRLVAAVTTASGKTAVRAYPDRDAPALASVGKGTTMEIIGNAGTWYYVKLYAMDGLSGVDVQYGFILGQYVDVGNYSEQTGRDDKTYGVAASASERDRLHLRREPSDKAESMGQYVNTTQVLILEEAYDAKANLWYKVEVDGQTGYVQAEHIRQVRSDSNASW